VKRMKNNLVITIVIVIIVGAAAFFGGIQYQKSKTPSFAQGQGGFRQRMGQGQQGQTAFRPVRGNVLSIDNNTMTVKLQDGSSKIVILSGGTAFMKEASATKDDLKVGDTVMATGTSNSDGSVTAQSIQINPPTARMPTQGAQ
jgi:hypothetical protein